MYGILVSALNFMLSFLVRSAIVKFVAAFALFYIVKLMAEVLTPLLPKVSVLNSAFSSISPGVWWFLDAFGFSYGFPLVISAYTTRFIIRRIPFIG